MIHRHRFPGLKPFSSNEAAVFFGRDEDIVKLCTSIIVNPTTLLFGKSGTGKSSLIQAGILPELNKSKTERNPEPYLPITILPKVYNPENKKNLFEKIITIIKENLGLTENNFLTLDSNHSSSLWYTVKQFQYQLKSKKSDQVLLLIFDQAEELFTHPDIEIDFMVKELQPVLGNFIPDDIQKIVNDRRSTLSRDAIDVLHSSIPVKFIFSIRSDKLHLITRLKKASPHVLQNSYELLPLNRVQAFAAIDGPSQLEGTDFISARFNVSDEAKKFIFYELSGGLKDPEYNFVESKIEPFSLQIICSYIEDYLVPKWTDQDDGQQEDFEVELELLEDTCKPNDVINDYYLNCVNNLRIDDQPLSDKSKVDVRILIEEKMISENRRIPLHESTIKQDKDCRVEQAVLEKLVEARILSKNYDSSGGSIYEITHDCLIEPILKAKGERADPLTRTVINDLLKEIDRLERNKSNPMLKDSRGNLTNTQNIARIESTKKDKFGDYKYNVNINVNAPNTPAQPDLATDALQVKGSSIEEDLMLFKTYKKLAQTYSTARDYEKAIEYFTKALESLPAHSNVSLSIEIYKARSDAYYYWKRYEKSNEDLKRILEQDPGDYTAMLYLVENFDKMNELEEGLGFLKKLKIDKKNAGIYTELGNKYYAKSQFALAIDCYQETLRLAPDTDYALRNIGLAEEARGNRESALKFYEQTIALKPGSAEILNDIGNIYYSLKDYDKARAKYLDALQADPYFYFAFHNLGLIEEGKRDNDAAIGYYQQAIEANPNYENSYIRMASIFYSKHEFDRARDIYQKLIEINPNNELNYYDLGLVEEQLKDWDAAIRCFSKTLELKPEDDKAWYSLGKNQHLANNIPQAIISLTKAIELNPQYAESFNELGLCYFDLEDWTKAKYYFTQAANLSPKQHVYHANTGIAESNLQNLDAAEKNFRKAIELKPNDKTSLTRLAGIYYDKQNWDQARSIYLKLTEIDPTNELNFYDLGLIEEHLQRWDDAIAYFTKVIELNPDDDKGWYELGKNQHSKGQFKQATESLAKSIELNPGNADYYTEMGLCFFDEKKWKQAREYFLKALEIDQTNPVYHSNMGAVEIELGNVIEAESYLKESIKLQPPFADAFFNYGDLLEKLNRPKEAVKQYKECLRLNPDDDEARKKIQSLERKMK